MCYHYWPCCQRALLPTMNGQTTTSPRKNDHIRFFTDLPSNTHICISWNPIKTTHQKWIIRLCFINCVDVMFTSLERNCSIPCGWWVVSCIKNWCFQRKTWTCIKHTAPFVNIQKVMKSGAIAFIALHQGIEVMFVSGASVKWCFSLQKIYQKTQNPKCQHPPCEFSLSSKSCKGRLIKSN